VAAPYLFQATPFGRALKDIAAGKWSEHRWPGTVGS
jgi:hypothetical protein